MNQLDLLSDQPISRATDPSTSHLAETEITRSGQRATQQIVLLRLVELHPGKTSAELARLGGVDRYVAARRLPELRTSRHVENGVSRTCAATNHKAMTWNLRR